MVELDGVAFSYGERQVLRAVDLALAGAELLCVVGPNGSGKTTLLKLIGGLLEPSAGRVRCFDLDPAATPRRDLATRLSFLPQHYQLAFPFSVLEVVLMGRYAHRPRGLLGLETEADLEIARQAMTRCDVLELADRRFDAISGGEQRRALLAQAFCQRSELILLDEPTSSLDPAHAISVFDALASETRERSASAIAVTHDLNLAARYADRVALLHDGQIAAVGEPRAVLESEATARAFRVGMHVGSLPDSEVPFVVPR